MQYVLVLGGGMRQDPVLHHDLAHPERKALNSTVCFVIAYTISQTLTVPACTHLDLIVQNVWVAVWSTYVCSHAVPLQPHSLSVVSFLLVDR